MRLLFERTRSTVTRRPRNSTAERARDRATGGLHLECKALASAHTCAHCRAGGRSPRLALDELSSDRSATRRVIVYDRPVGPATDPQRPEATRLGSYEILRKLARGGMAELFLARTVGPEGFQKLVVLKKILPHYAANPRFVRLFLDEARLAATLDHPHIAHVYDLGMVDGNYFFAMEYVHGQDVRATLRRTARLQAQFPIDHAVFIVHAVAAALHYAHERRRPDGALLGIVHRDVSPANLLVSYDGAIKLVDFGVAKAATSSVKTRTGTLKGKIAYMSPEQAKGSPIDRRSDVFALGIVLWEMVATQRLFKGDNDLATIQLIINSTPPPLRQLRPECPAELEHIVERALANDPAARYQTAEELQLALEEFAREHRLKQSAIALRAHMQELFADEIRAWQAAQASGVTLTDHVVSASVVEMTTPVSESEVSFLDDDDLDHDLELDDDLDHDEAADGPHQPPAQGVIVEHRARPNTLPPLEIAPSVEVARLDHTPVHHPSGAVPIVAMPPSPSGAVHQVSYTPPHAIATSPSWPLPIQHPPSGPIRIPGSDHSQPMIIPGTYAPEPSAFPIAPREWRHEDKLHADGDPAEHMRRRVIIGGLLALGALAVIALATGGTNPAPRAAPERAPAAVERPHAVDMQLEPAHEPAPSAPAPTGNPALAPSPASSPTGNPAPAPAPAFSPTGKRAPAPSPASAATGERTPDPAPASTPTGEHAPAPSPAPTEERAPAPSPAPTGERAPAPPPAPTDEPAAAATAIPAADRALTDEPAAATHPPTSRDPASAATRTDSAPTTPN